MIRLSPTRVNSWRLSKNHLANRAVRQDLATVVADVCGLQAQVLSGAAVSLWARVENITLRDVAEALWKQRSLVKTWAMRGTLYLLSSKSLPVYVAALRTHPDASLGRIPYRIGPEAGDREYHISRTEQEQITTAIHAALGAGVLTREELAKEIVNRVKIRPLLRSHLLSGFGSLLHQAAHNGSLIFGPSRGQKVTFTRPDKWLGRQTEPFREDALKILLRQFYTTYGPATPHDFAHWWGVSAPEAKALEQLVADELEEVEFEGHPAKILSRDSTEIQSIEEAHSIRLVPSWDTFVMFYHPRELFAPREYRARIFRQIQGNAPVLLVDGSPAGTWQRVMARGKIKTTVRPFSTLSGVQKGKIREEAALLGEFFGTNFEISYEPFQRNL